MTEKPSRFDRMSGLNAEQLDELEECVEELLEEPWDKGKGRPRELTFREALIVACGYERNNITEEIWAEIFDVHQSTISRYITFLTPLIDQATEEFRPSAEEAAEANRGAVALVDGTLWPCWSWSGKRCSWSGKYKTTGHGSLIITNLAGRITFVSEPHHGKPARYGQAERDQNARPSSKRLAESSETRDSSGLITSLPLSGSRKAASSTSASMFIPTRSALSVHPSSGPSPLLKPWRILFTDQQKAA